MEDYEKYFEYLKDLRRKGIKNQFGAIHHLQAEFKLSYEDAKKIIVEWNKNLHSQIRLLYPHVGI